MIDGELRSIVAENPDHLAAFNKSDKKRSLLLCKKFPRFTSFNRLAQGNTKLLFQDIHLVIEEIRYILVEDHISLHKTVNQSVLIQARIVGCAMVCDLGET